MLPYPFYYFASIWSFKRAFSNRTSLSWFQLIFTSLFLMSLTLLPVALQHIQLTTYPLDTFVDKAYAPLTDQVMEQMKDVQLENEQLTYHGQIPVLSSEDGQVILGHQEEPHDASKLTLYFDKDQLKVLKENKTLALIHYQGLTPDILTNKKELTTALSKNWYQENRVTIQLFLVLLSGFLLGINFLIVSLGATFFLRLTKKSDLFSFHTVKECFHFTLNCLGLPSLIGMLAGLLGQSLTTIITLENILFVLFIALCFYRTHFRDPEEE